MSGSFARGVSVGIVIAVGIVVMVVLAVLSFCAGPAPRPDRFGSPGINDPLPTPPLQARGTSSGRTAFPSSAAATANGPVPSVTGPGQRAAAPVPPAGTATPSRTPTTAAAAVVVRDAYGVLQAESFNARSGVSVEACAEGGTDIHGIASGDWVRYDGIDFGSTPPLDFVARVASGLSGGGSGLVQVRLSSPTSAPIGDFAIDNTGGWQSWRSVPGNVSGPTGRHTVYLTFTSAQSADYVSVNWFYFRH